MTKEITLTQGKVALVDDDDFERVSQYRWHAHRSVYGTWYAKHTIQIGGKFITSHLHRFILGITDRNVQVDHVDMNGLNCQKSNLRPTNQSGNQWNRKKYRNNTTGYKGVSFHKRNKLYTAQIRVNGTLIYLGGFASPEQAAVAYDSAAIKYHGEFARTNEQDRYL